MSKTNLLATGLCLAICAALAGPVHAELIAHWKMDDNAANTTVTDSSINNLHGTMSVNTSTASVSGKDGTALDIANTRSIDIDSPSPKLTGLTNFTVSMWLRDPATTGANDELFTWSDGTLDNRIQLSLTAAGKLATFAKPPGAPAYYTDVLTWTAGTWYHVAFTQSSGTMKVYQDGTVKNGAGWTSRPAPSSNANLDTVQIGSLNGSRNFYGKIDDVQVYGTALQGSDIQWLHGHPGHVIPEPSTLLLLATGTLCLVLMLLRRRRK